MDSNPHADRVGANCDEAHESAAPIADDTTGRRSGADRRDERDRRRNASGLFELRARRETNLRGRRKRDRRDSAWSWLAFWRRPKSEI